MRNGKKVCVTKKIKRPASCWGAREESVGNKQTNSTQQLETVIAGQKKVKRLPSNKSP